MASVSTIGALSRTKFSRVNPGVLSKKIAEMSSFGKSQIIGNVSHAQMVMPQKDFSFL